MEALIWILLPGFTAVASGLLAWFVMQSRMEVALARERERMAESRGALDAEKIGAGASLDTALRAAEAVAKREALENFMDELRVEQRHYTRENRMLMQNRKSLVLQERMYFRNIPLSDWIEHEITVERGRRCQPPGPGHDHLRQECNFHRRWRSPTEAVGVAAPQSNFIVRYLDGRLLENCLRCNFDDLIFDVLAFVCWPGCRASRRCDAPPKGDAAKGKAVFEQCGVCHIPDSDEKKMGPGLKGLFKKDKMTNGKKPTDATVRARIDEGGKRNAGL